MLTSQNNSRAATAPITSDILGEVRWYDATTEQFGAVPINAPQCTIGSNPGCTICLPFHGVADVHATLVFGRRFILLKAPYPTQISGRQIRESLIDKLTELTIGSVHLEIVPRHELGKTKRPRVIRSQELVDHASSLSHRDAVYETSSFDPLDESLHDPASPSSTSSLNQKRDGIDAIASTELAINQTAKSEERFTAIEASLGKLQSAVEIIQAQSLAPTPTIPVDLSQQLAAMGKSVAEELEQRLALRLDTQAASQAGLVNQIRDEALRPIESTLEGLLTKLDYLSTQQIQTTDQLEALAASTDFRLTEWDQWRASVLQTPEQASIGPHHGSDAFLQTEAQFSNPEIHTPLPTNYPSQYFSDDINQVSADMSVDPSNLQDNNNDSKQTFYTEESFYNQSGFDSPTDTESQYTSQENEYQNWGESDSSPASEQLPWGESAPEIPIAWNTTQESYPYAEQLDSAKVDDIEPAYGDQIPSEGYPSEDFASEGYFSKPFSSEAYGAHLTDYDSENEIPVLTTLENQAPRYDAYTDIVADEEQPYGLPQTDRSQELLNNESVDSSYDPQDLETESPLAAYLKSPLTERPSSTDDRAPSSYSANLDSFLAIPESLEDSTNVPDIPKDTPYVFPEESYAASDESRERDVLHEPTNELSMRLRQMLAEIKAEDEKSNVIDESDPYDQQEIIDSAREPGEEDQIAPPSWLRDYALSDNHHDNDPTMEMRGDSIETDKYLDEHVHRSDSPMVAFDLDSTTTLDAPPELPRFDWNTGSLISTDNDSHSSLLSSREEEDQSPLEEDYPSPSLSSTGVAHVDNLKEDKEESIEEYMQKLLQRVKQGSDGAETPLEDLTVRSAPRSRREFLNRNSKTSEPDDAPHELPKSGEPISESPKRPSPTQVDMDALRELANSNARRAIARSETKRANTTILIKVAITSFAIAAAALILLLNGFNMNPPFAGFVAALVVAFLWGTDCYKHFRALKAPASSKPVTTDPSIAGNNAVRTDDDTEGGWRPSPI